MTWTTTTIHLPWQRPPLTANQRLHWARRAKLTAHVRATMRLLMRQRGVARPPLAPGEVLHVWLEYTPPDKRRRDADNLVPTLKALCDGIVDSGLVPDDTPDLMVKHMPVIHPPQGRQNSGLVCRLTAKHPQPLPEPHPNTLNP